jgi:integrin beta 8
MTGRSGSSAPSGIPLSGSGTYGAGPSSPAPQGSGGSPGFGGSQAYPGPQDFRGDRPMSPPGPVEAFRPGPSGWSAPAQQHEQGRFGSFPPETDDRPASDKGPRPLAAKERNGRVLAMVLAAAVLLLVIPLGLVWVFTRSDGTTFDPAVGDCIKQSGDSAVTANCTEPGAYVVRSKVDDAKQCPDAKQPHVAVPGGGTNQILCLAPAPGASAGASTAPAPSAT